MIVPDSIDPIIAWRVWRYNELLGSLNMQGAPVHPGVPQYAQCYALRNHEVPSEACTCGIYALRSLENAAGKAREEMNKVYWGNCGHFAIGQIYLWGKVVEHETGWRAEYGYPKSILTDNIGLSARFAKLYNTEVETSCSWEKLFEPEELNSLEWSGHYFFPVASRALLPPPPTPAQQKKWNMQQLPATYQPKPLTSNRSVPKQLRAQVAQKEENAKSDFWKRL